MKRNRRRLSDQSGAVAITVAVMLVMLLVAGAFAVDLGGAWATKRDLVTDLDAAALAGAARAAMDGGISAAAEDAARTLYLANSPDADISTFAVGECTAWSGPERTGCLEVSGIQPSLISLARIMREDDIDVFGASAARFGPVQVTGNLKPFSVCKGDPDVAAFLDDVPGYFELSDEDRLVRFPVSKETAEDPEQTCGDVPGRSWGWTCFADWPCPQTNVDEYIATFYPGAVDVGTVDTAGTCDHPTPGVDCIAGGGSLGNSVGNALSGQVCPAGTPADNCPHPWTIVVHDDFYMQQGRGYYTPFAFLSFIVRDFLVTGPQHDRYLEVEFTSRVLEGTISPEAASTDFAIELCWGDSDRDGPAISCGFN